MPDHATKDDINDLKEQVRTVSVRVDGVERNFIRVSEDVHVIKGCIQPLCDNVESITSALTNKALSDPNQMVMMKLLDVVKVIVVALSIGGAIGAVGYYGMKASGNAGDINLEFEKKPE